MNKIRVIGKVKYIFKEITLVVRRISLGRLINGGAPILEIEQRNQRRDKIGSNFSTPLDKIILRVLEKRIY